MNFLDRIVGYVSPLAGLRRAQARIGLDVALKFDGATKGRRSEGWRGTGADANTEAQGALRYLRANTREIVRNNPYGRRALQVIAGGVVGWGIKASPAGAGVRQQKTADDIWNQWAESTKCDADGRHNFYGLQKLVMRTVAESGECLIRRRWRTAADNLPVPLQLQILEPDFLDEYRDGMLSNGNFIIQGIEFNQIGQRVAYHLFREHPGSNVLSRFGKSSLISTAVPASDIIHVYQQDRPGQVRGVPWFAAVILRLNDFDDFEDATLLKQKIAACFAAFVKDNTGTAGGLGKKKDDLIETIEPATVAYLPADREVTFATPPMANDYVGYSASILHACAAGLGVTYEQLTSDFSNVNYSSARMAQLLFQANIEDWRWNMLIPHACDGTWAWFLDAAIAAGKLSERVPVLWTPPPFQYVDPEKDVQAKIKAIRSGLDTLPNAIREQGRDPAAQLAEAEAANKEIDARGLILDSDPRKTDQTGKARGAATGGSDAGTGEQATQ